MLGRMKSPSLHPRVAVRLLAAGMLAGLAGCAGVVQAPAPGQTEQQLVGRHGPPTARHALPGGGTRLEYATGPFGRTTWMVDLDPAGRVTAAEQVLQEQALQRVQGRLPGMSRDELLRTLGSPGERRGGGWQGGEVWSYRYVTNDCLWFQVSLSDAGTVRDGTFGIDPTCDAPSDRE